jgi:hypothetical protein
MSDIKMSKLKIKNDGRIEDLIQILLYNKYAVELDAMSASMIEVTIKETKFNGVTIEV